VPRAARAAKLLPQDFASLSLSYSLAHSNGWHDGGRVAVLPFEKDRRDLPENRPLGRHDEPARRLRAQFRSGTKLSPCRIRPGPSSRGATLRGRAGIIIVRRVIGYSPGNDAGLLVPKRSRPSERWISISTRTKRKSFSQKFCFSL